MGEVSEVLGEAAEVKVDKGGARGGVGSLGDSQGWGRAVWVQGSACTGRVSVQGVGGSVGFGEGPQGWLEGWQELGGLQECQRVKGVPQGWEGGVMTWEGA